MLPGAGIQVYQIRDAESDTSRLDRNIRNKLPTDIEAHIFKVGFIYDSSAYIIYRLSEHLKNTMQV